MDRRPVIGDKKPVRPWIHSQDFLHDFRRPKLRFSPIGDIKFLQYGAAIVRQRLTKTKRSLQGDIAVRRGPDKRYPLAALQDKVFGRKITAAVMVYRDNLAATPLSGPPNKHTRHFRVDEYKPVRAVVQPLLRVRDDDLESPFPGNILHALHDRRAKTRIPTAHNNRNRSGGYTHKIVDGKSFRLIHAIGFFGKFNRLPRIVLAVKAISIKIETI
jgi:hypothetical protein